MLKGNFTKFFLLSSGMLIIQGIAINKTLYEINGVSEESEPFNSFTEKNSTLLKEEGKKKRYFEVKKKEDSLNGEYKEPPFLIPENEIALEFSNSFDFLLSKNFILSKEEVKKKRGFFSKITEDSSNGEYKEPLSFIDDK